MLTNLVTGDPAALLQAAIRVNPDLPPAAGDRHQILFSSLNTADLPSLTTEVIWVPLNPVLECSPLFTGLTVLNGWATPPTVVTAAYTTLSTDTVILANATTAAFTITLADATLPGFSPGQRITVIKTDSSGNAVTIAGTSGQLINGASTVTLAGQYATLSVVFDGTASNNWFEPGSGGGGGGGSPSGAAGGSLAGTYPNPGLAIPLTISGSGSAFGTLVSVTNTHGAPTQTPVGFTAAASGDRVLGIQVSGDSGSRWRVLSTGEQDWGTGTGSPDTNLYRASANQLQTDDAFNAALGVQVGGANVAAQWLPADSGWLVANGDYAAASAGAAALTAGTIYLQKLVIRQATTIATLTYLVTTGGSGSSTGSFVGLYNSSGAKLTGSSDVGTSLTSTGSIPLTLTTPQALAAGTYVYAAIVTNLASTQPSMPRFLASSAILANLSATAYRWATNGTGQTALPSSLTLSSNAATANTFFVAGS